MKPTTTAVNLKFLHNDYVPIATLLVTGRERSNRKEAFSVFWLGENFKNFILPLINDNKTVDEVLRQDELQCGTRFWAHKADPSKDEHISFVGSAKNKKNDTEIINDLKISMNDSNTIAERILQLLEDQMDGSEGKICNSNATVVGYITVSVDKKNGEESEKEEVIYTVMIGFLGPKYDNKWGVDAHINIPWASELQILSENK